MLSKIAIDNAVVKAKFHLERGEIIKAQKIYQNILHIYSKETKKIQKTLSSSNKLNQLNDLLISTKKNTIELLYEDEFLKISYCFGVNSNRCLVAFTGIGHSLGGIEVQSEEFFSQHKFGMVIWITDKHRSWGNNLNVIKISKYIKDLVCGKDIFIIGNSMGGFLGILFSGALKAKSVLAFVPQFSVSPRIVPTETRWMDYRINIKKYLYDDLSNSFNDNIKYAILLGSGGAEEIHYNKFLTFSNKPNIQIYKFVHAQHNVARYLKHLNLLNDCINTFFNQISLKKFFLKNSIKVSS